MKLTIGMMVKNESKYLERCLESLQPIMKAISSELVIIDTGSEDNTVEIARRYTDKIYFHPWDNNFSEMRNKTIGYGKGEWFLVIDGDEVLQDTKPLIEFLKSRENSKYGVACISVKNITTESDDTNYSVLVSPRLFKRDRHFRYEGIIHNQPVFKGLATALDMSLLHYGYMATDKELMERKFIRTSTILKAELEKEPNNIYYWYQLSVTYGMYKDYDGSLEYALKAYEVLHASDLLLEDYMYVYTHLAFVYQTLGAFEKVEVICREALAVQKFMYIDIYYFLAEALTVLEKPEEALQYYETYIRMAENYSEFGKDDGVIDYTVGQIDKVYFNLCNIYMRIGNDEFALDYGKKVKERELVNDLIAKIVYLFIKQDRYQDLRKYYEDVIKQGDQSIIALFFQSVENEKCQLTSEKKKALVESFAVGDNIYALLNKVMLDEWNDTQKLDSVLVDEISKLDFTTVPVFYGECLYYLLKYKCSLVQLLIGVKETSIDNYFEYLRLRKTNMSQLILAYLQGQDVSTTLHEVNINKLLSRYALFIDNLEEQEYQFAMEYYIREGITHLLAVYQPAIIENEMIQEMKSSEEVFFAYLALGKQHKEEGNSQEYLVYLKKSLHVFPQMKKVVENLLIKFKAENDSTPELENYKEHIKNNIKELIEQGKMAEALALIEEYESIVIDDVEVCSMKTIIAIVENRLDDAKKIVQQGLEINRTNFDLLSNLGYIYELQDENKKAAEIYNGINVEQLSMAQKEHLQEAIQKIKEKYKDVDFGKVTKRRKISFFVKPGMDSFIEDVIQNLSAEYETRKIIVSQSNQIDEGMQWADICWFEWCDELVVYGSQLEWAKDKKMVCRLHSYEAFTDWPQQVNWANLDKIIFVAEHIRDFVLEKVKTLTVQQTLIVPNGIDLAKSTFRDRQAGFNIAYVGYINYKKGPMLLLHAFKAIYDYDNRYRLYIAGVFQDERDVLYFKQMISKMGLEKNIFYQGWQDNVDQWLEDKNYIICTSVLESQNMSVMQAMAKGIKPLVHNFVGAENIYSPQYIWNTINQCVSLLSAEHYNSKEYNDFITRNYSLQKESASIEKMIADIERNNNESMGVVEEKFDYATYWNNRLNAKFDIEGVGYIGLGTVYNKQLYEIRINILNYILQKVFTGGLKDKRVLELGPGIGIFTNYFHSMKVKYEAIDIAAKSVKELKKHYRGYRFTQGDISNSALYKKNSYDLIFAADVLLHLTDEDKYKIAIQNISEGLTDQGYAVLYDPITLMNTKSSSMHVSIRDIEYIKQVCNDKGLEVVGLIPCSFFMNNPFDHELAENGAELIEIFTMIQHVFGTDELSEKEKESLAPWVATLEKRYLAEFGFGFSQKAIILKKISNKSELILAAKEIWNVDHVLQEQVNLHKKISALLNKYPSVVRLQELLANLDGKFKKQQCKPLVSVCITSYNYEKYLEQAILSVVDQTYENIELIIVDDCSTDKSVAIIKRYTEQYPHVKGIYNESNQGYCYGIRKFIGEWCNGKYFIILSADDMLATNETVTNFVKAHETVGEKMDFIYGDEILIDKDSKEVQLVKFEYIEAEKVVRDTFLRYGSGVMPFLFAMHRTDFYRYNHYAWAENIGATNDTLNSLVAIKKGAKYSKLDYPICRYRQHTENTTFNLSIRLRDMHGTIDYVIQNFDKEYYMDAEFISSDEKEQKVLKVVFLIKYYFSLIMYYCHDYKVYGAWEVEMLKTEKLNHLTNFKNLCMQYIETYLTNEYDIHKEFVLAVKAELIKLYEE